MVESSKYEPVPSEDQTTDLGDDDYAPIATGARAGICGTTTRLAGRKAYLLFGVSASVILLLLFGISAFVDRSRALNVMECGTSHTQALEAGCRFDIMSFSWLPQPCFDTNLTQSFLDHQPWEWYLDAEMTTLVPRDIVEQGRHDSLFVTWEYHLWHCTFMWKKLHRAYLHQKGVDDYINSYHHTQHCERVLHQGIEAANMSVEIVRKFPPCRPMSRGFM